MMKNKISNTVQNFKFFTSNLIKRNGIKKLLNSRELFKQIEGQDPYYLSEVLDFYLYPEARKVEYKLQESYPAFNDYDYEKSTLFNYSQPWIGLSFDTLQTPYSSFLSLFEYIDHHFEIHSMVDVGAAYGRAAIVKNAVFSHVQYTGYEIVKQRAEYALKVFKNLKLHHLDMKNCSIFEEEFPLVDLYIIYDFSNDADIFKILKQLNYLSSCGQNFLIAAKGSSTIELIRDYFDNFFIIENNIDGQSDWNLYSTTNRFQKRIV
jgi:hypothetical protein